MPATELFLFADSADHACECGRRLGGCYIELADVPEGRARKRMHALRESYWSHSVYGDTEEDRGRVQSAQTIRQRYVRLPDREAHDATPACFCGGRGIPYKDRPGVYDDQVDDLEQALAREKKALERELALTGDLPLPRLAEFERRIDSLSLTIDSMLRALPELRRSKSASLRAARGHAKSTEQPEGAGSEVESRCGGDDSKANSTELDPVDSAADSPEAKPTKAEMDRLGAEIRKALAPLETRFEYPFEYVIAVCVKRPGHPTAHAVCVGSSIREDDKIVQLLIHSAVEVREGRILAQTEV